MVALMSLSLSGQGKSQLGAFRTTHYKADAGQAQLTEKRLPAIPGLHLAGVLAVVAGKASGDDVADVMRAALVDRLHMLHLHVALLAAVGTAVAELIEALVQCGYRNLQRSLTALLGLASVLFFAVVQPKVKIDLVFQPPVGLSPLLVVLAFCLWVFLPVQALGLHHELSDAGGVAAWTEGALKSALKLNRIIDFPLWHCAINPYRCLPLVCQPLFPKLLPDLSLVIASPGAPMLCIIRVCCKSLLCAYISLPVLLFAKNFKLWVYFSLGFCGLSLVRSCCFITINAAPINTQG